MHRILVVIGFALSIASHANALDATEAIDTTVCALVQRPLDFENKRVRVQAIIQTGPEFFGVTTEACSPDRGDWHGAIWLDYPGDDEFISYYRGWSTGRFIQAVHSGELGGDGPVVPWRTALSVDSPVPE